jgi:hypothetical protein
MATNQDVFAELQNIKAAILGKGGSISQANTNVSLPELTAGVNSISAGGGSYTIVAAELFNITLSLYDDSDNLIQSLSTGAEGGRVDFSVTSSGTYTVKAKNASDTELWARTVEITDIGVYYAKSGKALNSYAWAEIETASNGGYAKYMWSVGDTKDLSSVMGQTSATYTRAEIIGFNHDDKADESGKVGITFKLPYTSATYSHTTLSTANINGISWVGSNIRQNCLKAGEGTYVYDITVTSSTSGTYYNFNEATQTFSPVTLPAAYASGTKYYNLVTASSDGAFVAGMPSDVLSVIKKVEKKTWGGYGGAVTNSTQANSDNTVFKTQDWLFMLADCEVFGTSDRFSTLYSKIGLEGEQYDYYKKYAEYKLRLASTQWLRSPYPADSSYFAYWTSNGYVSCGYASNACRVALCFCI